MPDFPLLSVRETVARLKDCRRALIFCHVNPDGDTVGCAFALKLLLEAMGKTAHCRCAGEPAPALRFMLREQSSLSVPGPVGDEDEFDLLLAVDVASPGQLGSLEPLAPRCGLMIDHHETGTPFAPILLDSAAAAAGEIVYRIYEELLTERAVPVLPDVCRLLYAAVAFDTGSFKYSSVTENTFHTAAALLPVINRATDGGETAAEISRLLFDSHPAETLRANALAIRNLRFFAGGRLALSLITGAEMAAEGLTEGALSETTDIPRSVQGVEIGLMLKQAPAEPRRFRVSSRSNGEASVAAVCQRFGGGGHAKAAGCTMMADSPEEAVRLAADAFSAALETV